MRLPKFQQGDQNGPCLRQTIIRSNESCLERMLRMQDNVLHKRLQIRASKVKSIPVH